MLQSGKRMEKEVCVCVWGGTEVERIGVDEKDVRGERERVGESSADGAALWRQR